MRGLVNHCNLALQLLLLSLTALSSLSEARNGKHHSTAVLVGTVYCDTCFQDDFSRSSHFISGATVAVECREGAFKVEAKTNKQGKFRVQLPPSISKHQNEIKGCQVSLVKSSEPYCAVAALATSSSIHLKSRKQGTHVFSAGFFTFKPLKQPGLCNQQPSITRSTSLLDPITNSPLLGPIIQPLPPLLGLPNLPNPFQSPSPPSFDLPGIPGLPGLTPSPPLTPAFPIPFPPGRNGVPPARKVSP